MQARRISAAHEETSALHSALAPTSNQPSESTRRVDADRTQSYEEAGRGFTSAPIRSVDRRAFGRSPLLASGSLSVSSPVQPPHTRESYIPTPSGRVWCRVVGSGRATPLLAVHGGPAMGSGYLEVLTTLAEDRPVILYDQLGCGASDGITDLEFCTVERFASEITAVRDALGLTALHILGHSWGGLLALEHVLTGAGGVRSLVLSSVPISIANYVDDLVSLRARLPADVLDALTRHECGGTTDSNEYLSAVMVFRQKHLHCSDPWRQEMMDALISINPVVFTTLWGSQVFACDGALKTYDRVAELAKVRVPVLFTAGEHDTATPKRSESYCGMVPSGALNVIPGAGHMTMLDAPAAYVASVRAFLAQVEAR